MQIEVWDQDVRGRDEVIGKSSFSLLSVYKKGYVDTWAVIKRPGDDGERKVWLVVYLLNEPHFNGDICCHYVSTRHA